MLFLLELLDALVKGFLISVLLVVHLLDLAVVTILGVVVVLLEILNLLVVLLLDGRQATLLVLDMGLHLANFLLVNGTFRLGECFPLLLELLLLQIQSQLFLIQAILFLGQRFHGDDERSKDYLGNNSRRVHENRTCSIHK